MKGAGGLRARHVAITDASPRMRTTIGHVAATIPEHARCRHEPRLTVSLTEQAALEREDHRASRPLVWHASPLPGAVELETAPCPFLYDACWCAIYHQRPARCR